MKRERGTDIGEEREWYTHRGGGRVVQTYVRSERDVDVGELRRERAAVPMRDSKCRVPGVRPGVWWGGGGLQEAEYAQVLQAKLRRERGADVGKDREGCRCWRGRRGVGDRT